MAVATRAPSEVTRVRCALYRVPLQEPVSDAKVTTGRQRPLGDVDVVIARIATADGLEGLGFSYSKRAGGPALFAHAKQLAPLLIGEDALDTGRIWHKLLWAAASIGRQGVSVQSLAAFDIALHDRKAKQAGLSVAKLIGSHRDAVRAYDTTVGFLSSGIDAVIAAAERSLARGMGGIKLKVGGAPREDVARVGALRKALGSDVAIMVTLRFASHSTPRSRRARCCPPPPICGGSSTAARWTCSSLTRCASGASRHTVG